MDWNILYKLVVEQRSRVKNLSSLVGYDGNCLAAIRHVKSILCLVQPRPNIRSLSSEIQNASSTALFNSKL